MAIDRLMTERGRSQPAGCLILFWDYDTQWGADRSRLPGGPKPWGRLEFDATDELLSCLGEYDVPACFAVVAAAALPGERPYHDPLQIKKIHAAGHEVASHSFQHEWVPGLGPRALIDTLRRSKEVLEDCVGAPVRTFVPPYNRPMDYPGAFAFSLSERREVLRDRTGLRMLCDALGETGYGFCRVAYRSLQHQLLEYVMRRRIDRPSELIRISGITCARLNTPCGFDERARDVLQNCAARGGVVIAWGHPHSLHSGNPQDLKHLVPFLDMASSLRRQGRLTICRPMDVLSRTQALAA
jgi:Polysaccharide deacetylase